MSTAPGKPRDGIAYDYCSPSGSAGHWRAQVAVNHPRKLWGFKSLPAHAQQTAGPHLGGLCVRTVDQLSHLGNQIDTGLNGNNLASMDIDLVEKSREQVAPRYDIACLPCVENAGEPDSLTLPASLCQLLSNCLKTIPLDSVISFVDVTPLEALSEPVDPRIDRSHCLSSQYTLWLFCVDGVAKVVLLTPLKASKQIGRPRNQMVLADNVPTRF